MFLAPLAFLVLAAPRAIDALTAFDFPDCVNGPLSRNTVCDTTSSPSERATALIQELTFEEKVNNTGNTSPGVPRLGLPPYQWWQEALHGVAFSFPDGPFTRSGDFSYATSFPQPILMGAAFDDDLITEVATVISTEARAFSNAKRSGLDFWTPNINPFKDPRWGRGQETPGEDTFHLASYIHALLKGLQGEPGDKYKRVVATCKHYVGYDLEVWNGNFRHHFDAQITTQDMAEYYMRPFQACARDSNVGAIMCSYNANNGVPSCADPYLLQTILREHWNWNNEEQWITGDCEAVSNIYLPHLWASTREQAVADALNAGTDLDCGSHFQRYLPSAFEQGLFNESTLDRALIRQFSSLIRLGYFDPAEEQPYRQLGWSDINTPHAQELALKIAQEGIVLLKNDGLLPLPLDSALSVAISGDWANATAQMQGNYFGRAPYLHSPLMALQQLGVNIVQSVDADVIIYASGIDLNAEDEFKDRISLAFNFQTLNEMELLAKLGKPMIVFVMGGGQLDTSPLIGNANISAVLWAGIPGQDGGTAMMDVLAGKVAPAGRLPITQYPAKYNGEMPMTDMTLRPGPTSPGRTYRWYTGTPIFDFGYGLHYTNFSVQVSTPPQSTYGISDLLQACNETYLDNCAFDPLGVDVTNMGELASDYVVLVFLGGEFGAEPFPKKTLVAYTHLFDVKPFSTANAMLNLTLGSLARVDKDGNKVLFPGEYTLMVDTQPLTSVDFTLVGDAAVLEEWPAPPPPRTGDGVPGYEDYFVGGYGSVNGPIDELF